MHDFLSKSQRKWILGIIAAAAIIRLVTLGSYPLTDNTEARYAEVAREMVSTGNWIAPQLHGEKFWSKPPLSIWATAGSMKIFGMNEFAARMPHLIFSIITLWLVYHMALRRKGRDTAWVAVAFLATSAAFFVCSSGVMTDATLVLGTTLSMVGFWQALDRRDGVGRLWGYLFFAGLGISLLAKGPVGVVLTFLPIGIWVIWKKQWRTIWSGIPWGTGMLLTIALTLPWYLASEVRTPGFLHYFFIGEHWYRFIKPGWEGDLYGTAHIQPRGMIWLMWIMAAFPWSFLLLGSWLGSAAKWRRTVPALLGMDGYETYLMLWALVPMFFFSLAGNILWTYVLPGIPAFALLMSDVWMSTVIDGSNNAQADRNRFVTGLAFGLCVPMVFGTMILMWFFTPAKNSQKCLVTQYLAIRPQETSRLVYLYDRPYSAEFYSSGTAIEIKIPQNAISYFADDIEDFFALKKKRMNMLPPSFQGQLVHVDDFDDVILLREDLKARRAPDIGANSNESLIVKTLSRQNLSDNRSSGIQCSRTEALIEHSYLVFKGR